MHSTHVRLCVLSNTDKTCTKLLQYSAKHTHHTCSCLLLHTTTQSGSICSAIELTKRVPRSQYIIHPDSRGDAIFFRRCVIAFGRFREYSFWPFRGRIWHFICECARRGIRVCVAAWPACSCSHECEVTKCRCSYRYRKPQIASWSRVSLGPVSFRIHFRVVSFRVCVRVRVFFLSFRCMCSSVMWWRCWIKTLTLALRFVLDALRIHNVTPINCKRLHADAHELFVCECVCVRVWCFLQINTYFTCVPKTSS